MTRAYELLAGHYDVELIRFPSGEDCGSWTSPPEWQARTGRLTGPDGEVVADVADHVLHLYPYSPPFSGTVTLDELQPHLMSNPNRPDAIPFFYRNQYRHWDTEWGFAIPHAVRENLKPGDYTVEIDTAFTPGWMYMAEQVCNGEHPDSVLMVGHFDHPAMCNDGLVQWLPRHARGDHAAERGRPEDAADLSLAFDRGDRGLGVLRASPRTCEQGPRGDVRRDRRRRRAGALSDERPRRKRHGPGDGAPPPPRLE